MEGRPIRPLACRARSQHLRPRSAIRTPLAPQMLRFYLRDRGSAGECLVYVSIYIKRRRDMSPSRTHTGPLPGQSRNPWETA